MMGMAVRMWMMGQMGQWRITKIVGSGCVGGCRCGWQLRARAGRGRNGRVMAERWVIIVIGIEWVLGVGVVGLVAVAEQGGMVYCGGQVVRRRRARRGGRGARGCSGRRRGHCRLCAQVRRVCLTATGLWRVCERARLSLVRVRWRWRRGRRWWTVRLIYRRVTARSIVRVDHRLHYSTPSVYKP